MKKKNIKKAAKERTEKKQGGMGRPPRIEKGGRLKQKSTGKVEKGGEE